MELEFIRYNKYFLTGKELFFIEDSFKSEKISGDGKYNKLCQDIIEKFILTYLNERDEYLKLSTRQQQVVYETCKTIMTAIYNSIKFENVFPVIMCGDVEAQKIINKAIKNISTFLPSTEKITIAIVH